MVLRKQFRQSVAVTSGGSNISHLWQKVHNGCYEVNFSQLLPWLLVAARILTKLHAERRQLGEGTRAECDTFPEE